MMGHPMVPRSRHPLLEGSPAPWEVDCQGQGGNPPQGNAKGKTGWAEGLGY